MNRQPGSRGPSPGRRQRTPATPPGPAEAGTASDVNRLSAAELNAAAQVSAAQTTTVTASARQTSAVRASATQTLTTRNAATRRRFLRLSAGAVCMPFAGIRANQEIDLPDDPRLLIPSPTPPWEQRQRDRDRPTPRSVWPRPVVEVRKASDLPLAVATINTAGAGTLLWGEGTFRIPPVSSNYTALYFANLGAFRMQGQGAGKTLLMQDHPPSAVDGQLRLCNFENIGRLDLADFSMDGQRQRYDLPDTPATGENAHWRDTSEELYRLHNNREAMNNIFMRNIGGGSLSRLHNISSRGDFVNLANVSNLLIHDCDIQDCGRNGITLGGERGLEWSRNIEISHCHFHGDIDTQMIDLELHGRLMATPSQFNRNLYIHDCVFEEHRPNDAVDRDQFGIVLYAVFDFRVERCDIRSPVIVRNGHGRFADNTGGITQFTMDRFSKADIQRTRFSLKSRQREGNQAVSGFLVIRRDELSPLRLSMSDCDIDCAGVKTPLLINDCAEVILRKNRFSGGRELAGLVLEASAVDMQASLAGNTGLAAAMVRTANGRQIALSQS